MASYDFFTVLENLDNRGIEEWLRKGGIDLYSFLTLMHGRECREVRRVADDRREEQGGLAKVVHKRMAHVPGRASSSRYSRNLVTDAGAAQSRAEELGLVGIDSEALLRLPEFAVALEFSFTLEKDYISRDDAPFYPTDNPIRKDWVFKIPMVSGATWKGSLRAAAVDALLEREQPPEKRILERLDLIGIFGDEKRKEHDEDTNAQDTLRGYLDQWFEDQGIPKKEFEDRERKRFGKDECERFGAGRKPEEPVLREGRVRCFPSYFDRIELVVINPRDRRTRAGTLPIEMEVAPAGAKALFSMLYLPFDLLGQPRAEILRAAQRDWELLGQALVRMFRASGFGAKKSSGCGKACDELASEIRLESAAPELKSKKATRIEELAKLYLRFEAPHEA